jgi:hypothetical protein
MLVEASQTTNIKLVDVAHWLVAQLAGTPEPEAPARAVPVPDRVDRREPRR